jgi:hypothetical protein
MPTPATTPRPRIVTGSLGIRTLERRASRAALAAEWARYEAERARASRKAEARIDAELGRFRAIEQKYFPAAAPPLHRLADASGQVWTHEDRGYLTRWVAERDRKARAAKASAAPRGWRADGVVEHKAIIPSS